MKTLGAAFITTTLAFLPCILRAEMRGLPDVSAAFRIANDVVLARVTGLGPTTKNNVTGGINISVLRVLKGGDFQVSLNRFVNLTPEMVNLAGGQGVLPGIRPSLVGRQLLLFLNVDSGANITPVHEWGGIIQTLPAPEDSGAIPPGLAGVAYSIAESFRAPPADAAKAVLDVDGPMGILTRPGHLVAASDAQMADIYYHFLQQLFIPIDRDVAAPEVVKSLAHNAEPIGRLWQTMYLYEVDRLQDPSELEHFALSPNKSYPSLVFDIAGAVCTHFWRHYWRENADVEALATFLASPLPRVRACAIGKLGDYAARYGTFETVPYLLKAVDDTDKENRYHALSTLCALLPGVATDADDPGCGRYGRAENRKALIAALDSTAHAQTRHP